MKLPTWTPRCSDMYVAFFFELAFKSNEQGGQIINWWLLNDLQATQSVNVRKTEHFPSQLSSSIFFLLVGLLKCVLEKPAAFFWIKFPCIQPSHRSNHIICDDNDSNHFRPRDPLHIVAERRMLDKLSILDNPSHPLKRVLLLRGASPARDWSRPGACGHQTF